MVAVLYAVLHRRRTTLRAGAVSGRRRFTWRAGALEQDVVAVSSTI